MKKFITFSLSLFLMALTAFVSFADTTIPSADLRSAADSLDLSSNMENCVGEIGTLHGQGVRLFDAGHLLSADQADKVEEILDGVADQTGFDIAIVTTDGFSGQSDSRAFADYLYIKSGFGSGSDQTGTMLVVNMTDRDLFIYTRGAAIQYITDSQQAYIYDELDGGVVAKLGSGDYAGACAAYAKGVYDGYLYGVENGVGEPKKKGLTPFKVIISAIISAISGFLPVSGVKRQYAMQTEKRMAEGFNLAYRANSNMMLAAGPSGARLINRDVTRAPIPVVRPNDGGRSSGHGGGISTTHTSIGGGVHGGTGRKF